MMDKNQDRGIAERTVTGTSRADLPLLIDHAAIALESVRTQWRTLGDLGTHERMALSQLRVYGSMPMSELASRISLSRAAVTSLVDRLEADGWVRRDPDDLDRRRTVLRLQPTSAERWGSVVASFNTDLDALTSDMSDDEVNAVTNFLKRLASLSERHAGELRASAVERALQ